MVEAVKDTNELLWFMAKQFKNIDLATIAALYQMNQGWRGNAMEKLPDTRRHLVNQIEKRFEYKLRNERQDWRRWSIGCSWGICGSVEEVQEYRKRSQSVQWRDLSSAEEVEEHDWQAAKREWVTERRARSLEQLNEQTQKCLASAENYSWHQWRD